MTNKLLPCPFCGGTDVHLWHIASASMSWVSCVGCGLEAPSETGVTDDAAVAYWNRRAAPPVSNMEAHEAFLEAFEDFHAENKQREAERQADIEGIQQMAKMVGATFEPYPSPQMNEGEESFAEALKIIEGLAESYSAIFTAHKGPGTWYASAMEFIARHQEAHAPQPKTHVNGERKFCDFPNCDCSSGAAERCGHPPESRGRVSDTPSAAKETSDE